jgi:hypothetical protein
MSRKVKFMLAVIAAVPPLIVALWSLATAAAEKVMDPHKADAKSRVQIMCEWARVQNYNTEQICDNVGARCKTLDATILVSSGCLEDGK